jgi:hypothetical protein
MITPETEHGIRADAPDLPSSSRLIRVGYRVKESGSLIYQEATGAEEYKANSLRFQRHFVRQHVLG